MNSRKKILITGVAGFIGFHLAKKCIEKYDVYGIDNLNNYYDVSLKYGRLKELGINNYDGKQQVNFFTFEKIDICDKKAINKLFSENKFYKVINLAAQAGVRYSISNPEEYISSNINGFFNILECVRNHNVKELIYASSSSVYGNSKEEYLSEDDKTEKPVSLYASTKKSNELMAHSYSDLYSFTTIGLRFFTVFGAWGRPDMAPMLFSEAITKGKTIKVFNNGEMWRDFTFIDDLIIKLMKVIDANNKGCEIYNIGSSRPTFLKDFISELENCLGTVAKKEFLPMQKGDVVRTSANMEKFEKQYGKNDITTLHDAVLSFVKWFKNTYKKL